jgi:hypothetical protein
LGIALSNFLVYFVDCSGILFGFEFRLPPTSNRPNGVNAY